MAHDERENRDAMTGLDTRQTFLKVFEEEITKADGEETCVSLAFADLDQFGKLNDEHGAAIGDEVIKSIARHLADAISGKGRVFRYGGEEFAVVLPGMEKEGAFLVMESVRSAFDRMNEHVFVADGKEVRLNVTFSVGLATYPDDGAREQEIVRKADEALYRAKESGRNRVSLSREEKMVTKTSHYTQGQLERLSRLAKREGVGEAVLLREALDDLLRKYLIREV